MTKAKGFRQGDGPREEKYGCLGKYLQNKHHPRRNTSFTSAFSWGIHMNQVSVRCDMRMYLWGLFWQSIILETFLRVIMECIVEPSLCLHMCLCICVYAVSVAYVCVCAHECARVHDYGYTGGGQIRTLGAFLSYHEALLTWVSHWTWRSCFHLAWLDSGYWGSTCLHWISRITGKHSHAGFFIRLLEIWTQIPLSSFQEQ